MGPLVERVGAVGVSADQIYTAFSDTGIAVRCIVLMFQLLRLNRFRYFQGSSGLVKATRAVGNSRFSDAKPSDKRNSKPEYVELLKHIQTRGA